MPKVTIHNPLANQHLDHSHMNNFGKTDEEATQRIRNDLNKSFERLHNSPFMQLQRDREKGIHPTSYDKYL